MAGEDHLAVVPLGVRDQQLTHAPEAGIPLRTGGVALIRLAALEDALKLETAVGGSRALSR